MKGSWCFIKSVAKKHTFNFIIILLIAFGMAVDAIQSVTVAAFDMSLDNHKNAINRKIDNYQSQYNSEINTSTKNFKDQLERFNSTLNARVDTLDSAIDPESKRRALLKTIRDAITDNTNTKLGIRVLNRIGNAVIDFSYKHNVSMAMVLAQMQQESDFDHKAHSHAGAKGLMQILDNQYVSTADTIAGELGYRHYNIWDIRTNVEFGCYYLSKMLTAFNNNYEDALRAYNFGPSRVLEVRAGKIDYSQSKIVVEDGKEVKYLVDKYGEFELDKNGNKIIVQEKHMYPKETRDYIKYVKRNREIYAEHGLDKVE